MEDFFSIANFEQITEKTGKNRVILLIDECHRFFPVGYSNQAIYDFFAYHGHIGLDVILMCQSLERTSRMFNPLLEYVVNVTPRSRAVLNNFSYSFVDLKGRFLYSKTLSKSKLVFNAYKSFRKDEHHKPKNAVKHWIIISVVFLIVAGFLFKSALAIVKGKSNSGRKASDIAQKRLSPVSQTVPLPPATPGPIAPSVSPPVFHPVTTSIVARRSIETLPVSGSPTVAGFIDAGRKRHYLLSNGRMVASSRVLNLGDYY